MTDTPQTTACSRTDQWLSCPECGAVPLRSCPRRDPPDLAIRHALTIMRLSSLLREARDSRAADIVPNGWATRVDEALQL